MTVNIRIPGLIRLFPILILGLHDYLFIGFVRILAHMIPVPIPIAEKPLHLWDTPVRLPSITDCE